MSLAHRRLPVRIGAWLAAGLLAVACGGAPPALPSAPPALPSLAPVLLTATPSLPAPLLPVLTPVPPASTLAPPAPTLMPASPIATAIPSSPAAVATVPPAASPAGSASLPPEVARALAEFAAARSFRSTAVVVTRSAGNRTDVRMDYLAPDRLLLMATGQRPEQNAAVVVIGATTYAKAGDSWLKLEDAEGRQAVASLLRLFDPRALLAEAARATYTPAGSETVDGEPCAVFTFANSAGGTGTLWIARRDGLVRKMDVRTSAADLTMMLGHYNQPLVIEAPL